jgi:hypothetical protein
MAKRKIEGEEKPKRAVTFEEIKPGPSIILNREDYLVFLDIYHYIRPYLNRPIAVTKQDTKKKWPDHKQMVDDIWMCIDELGLKWPDEMIGRIFNT